MSYDFDPYKIDRDARAAARGMELRQKRVGSLGGVTIGDELRRANVHANQTARAKKIPVTLAPVFKRKGEE